MKQRQRALHFLPACNDTVRQFCRGISLHGHTQNSHENLGFLNRHIDTVPIVSRIARHGLARFRQVHGKELDFRRAYWTAPLTAGDAHTLERRQIEDGLGLEGIVSMTDHDNIDGALEIRKGTGGKGVVSLEWSVPYKPAYFHLGVHNLPPDQARTITERLLEYTRMPEESRLGELMAMLDAIPQVLVVLNHPFWEMEPIGNSALLEMVSSFLRNYGRYIHALEVNGLRPWKENQLALEMAESLGLAVVSGGDRHGWEPSTMLNLTRACCFSEFVAEIRGDGQSEIVVMPNYQAPLGLRMMQVAWDVIREYPQHSCGRVHWTDRVFYESEDGTALPLTACFKLGEPRELRLLMAAMRMLERRPWHSMLHAVWSRHSSHTPTPGAIEMLEPTAHPAFTSGEGSAA